MLHIVRVLITIDLVVACGCGCASHDRTERRLLDGDATVAVESRLASSAEIRFVSANGFTHGTDSDIELTLLPGGRARVSVYGLAVQHFDGTYRISPTGAITVDFPLSQLRWPAMSLWQNGNAVLLWPINEKPHSIEPIDEGGGIIWPLRAVAQPRAN